jgi:hypothetical protein
MTRTRSRKTTLAELMIVTAIGFVALTSRVRQSEAATITVNGSCSLSQAITAVNTKKKTGGCAAGTGGDTIVVSAGSTISVNSPLTITRSVTIQSSVAKNMAVLQIDTAASQTAMFIISPLAGTAAAVTFVDLRLMDLVHQGTGVRGVGRNSADKLTLNRCQVFSFVNSGVSTVDMAVTIADSTFQLNSSPQSGGALRIQGSGSNSALNISNSEFEGNTAVEFGGAIYDASPAHSTINNSTLLKNFANVGGALALVGTNSIFDINGSTIVNNTVSSAGGGGMGVATVNLTMTILAANFIDGNPDLFTDWDFNSTLNSVKDSLLADSFSFDAAGGFAAIPINSFGANSIVDVNSSNGEVCNLDAFNLGGDLADAPPTVALNPTGFAVDAIPSNSTSLAADQRGFARGIDAPGGVGSNRFDIGAVEFDPNLQAENLFATSTTNGTLSQVSGIAGFQPSSGKGIKFVPNASGAASVTFRLPMTVDNIDSLILHVQSCPTCGTYKISVGDVLLPPIDFIAIGTQSFSSATTKVVTLPAMTIVDDAGVPESFGEDEVIDVKFTLVSKPPGSNGQMVLDFIKEHQEGQP